MKWEGSLEELKQQNFKDLDKITFTCKECGKEFTYAFHIMMRKKELLCKGCQTKKTKFNQRKTSFQSLPWLQTNTNVKSLEDLKALTNKRTIERREELKNHLTDLNIDFEMDKVIDDYTVTFYIPSKNIAIDYDGNIWIDSKERWDPSNGRHPRLYFQDKSLYFKEKGIHLIHIFEHEWNEEDRKKRIKDYISYLLVPSKPVYARACKIKEIDSKTAADFIDKYHIQGKDISTIKIGLFYNEELVEVMTFGRSRFNKEYEWEISRLVAKGRVVGGASKLYKYFLEKYNPKSVISYCDISKMTGKVYEKLGLELVRTALPNYVWANENEFHRRYNCQVHKLRAKGYVGTEVTIMEGRGFYRCYDAGNYTFGKVYR